MASVVAMRLLHRVHALVQGSVQRPLDITSLRIDQAERMGLQLADALISPTAYMTAFLKQRAWRLPKTSLVIPNVLPAPDEDTPSQACTLAGTDSQSSRCIVLRWPEKGLLMQNINT